MQPFLNARNNMGETTPFHPQAPLLSSLLKLPRLYYHHHHQAGNHQGKRDKGNQSYTASTCRKLTPYNPVL
jgi:hypothetical protein